MTFSFFFKIQYVCQTGELSKASSTTQPVASRGTSVGTRVSDVRQKRDSPYKLVDYNVDRDDDTDDDDDDSVDHHQSNAGSYVLIYFPFKHELLFLLH